MYGIQDSARLLVVTYLKGRTDIYRLAQILPKEHVINGFNPVFKNYIDCTWQFFAYSSKTQDVVMVEIDYFITPTIIVGERDYPDEDEELTSEALLAIYDRFGPLTFWLNGRLFSTSNLDYLLQIFKSLNHVKGPTLQTHVPI
jgi:hypothetical protein